jgi:hypothetical protein
MRTFCRILKISLFLFIIFSLLQCSRKPVSDCNSKKIEMLLEDVFRKQTLIPLFEQYDSSKISLIKKWKKEGKEKELVKSYEDDLLNDSSMFFNYLYSKNINIPKKEYYIHWCEKLEPAYRDSVKLIVINDLRMKNKHANNVGIGFLEVDEDTSNIKIYFAYGTQYNIAVQQKTFSYHFDKKNCKWNILDSTISKY